MTPPSPRQGTGGASGGRAEASSQPSNSFDLTGKVAIVTGGGRGIGRAITRGLAAHGATVVVCGRTPATLDAVAAETHGTAHVADISREPDVIALRDAIVAQHGRIDILVCNAGINPIYKSIETTTLDEWQQVLDTNLTGAFLCCKHLGTPMLQQNAGSIICISSVAGHVGLRRSVPYCATKGGLELLVRALALDWAAKGVRVNAIAPGYFETDLTAGMVANPILSARLLAATPMGRFGRDADIVGAAVFLASDASAYVTGQSLLVDGGLRRRMNSWDDASERFDLRHALAQLSGTADATNACVECCDRHPAGRIAVEWRGADGAAETLTFGDLRALSCRAANVLAAHGVQPGDRVSGLLPRRPALLALILGTWRLGAVYQPLFTAFGPAAITGRLRAAAPRVVVTDALNRPKIEAFDGAPAVLLDEDILRGDAAAVTPAMRRQADPFMLLFTSGTTGPAKMVEVPIRALAGFIGYMRHALDLRTDDRFWNIADPGWAYGLYYAVAGPLAMGHATTFFDGPFTVPSLVRTAAELRITNLAAAPTAYRMLAAAGPEAVAPLRGLLRVASSAGEPLNPEVIRWFDRHLGVAVHDQYGQTELGMVVCNHHALRHPVRPGSAGFPSPGYRVAVVDDAGVEVPRSQPGNLAIDRNASPLFWFDGYLGAASQPFVGRYYLTGDTVEMHPDGSVAFIGRADDVITSSGYRIGPFDVESALLEHPAVVEAAVVGKADPERTEIVKAFVVLHPTHAPGPTLAEALRQHVRQRLSAHAYPREIAFVELLPKTPSGKLQRFVLRAGEHG